MMNEVDCWLINKVVGLLKTQNSQNSKAAENTLQREGLLNNLLISLPETFVEIGVNSVRNSWLQIGAVGIKRITA